MSEPKSNAKEMFEARLAADKSIRGDNLVWDARGAWELYKCGWEDGIKNWIEARLAPAARPSPQGEDDSDIDLRNLIEGIPIMPEAEVTAYGDDNFAIALATYFSDRHDCPEDDVDDELGWSKWAMEHTHSLADRIAQELRARLSATADAGREVQEYLDRAFEALRLYGSQFEEVFQLAHKRPVPSSIGAMLCNMTERHSCEMAKAFTGDEIARRMATHAALGKNDKEMKQ